mmetsp:Transcript_807/g.1997  ORF Transcript_807/g.1997 Transcript_807/m.1997 type:complete len:231 (+) Transcript_807:786-1478(+)
MLHRARAVGAVRAYLLLLLEASPQLLFSSLVVRRHIHDSRGILPALLQEGLGFAEPSLHDLHAHVLLLQLLPECVIGRSCRAHNLACPLGSDLALSPLLLLLRNGLAQVIRQLLAVLEAFGLLFQLVLQAQFMDDLSPAVECHALPRKGGLVQAAGDEATIGSDHPFGEPLVTLLEESRSVLHRIEVARDTPHDVAVAPRVNGHGAMPRHARRNASLRDGGRGVEVPAVA